MGIRRVKGKTYSGVYEYFKASDSDKTITAFYIQYKDEGNVTRTRKCSAADKDEALDLLNEKRSEVRREKKRMEKEGIRFESQKRNQTLSLDQYAEVFHPTRENKDAKDEKAMYYNHISSVLGKKKIAKLTRDDMINFRQSLEKKMVKIPKVVKDYENDERYTIIEEIHLSPKTIRNILDYLRVILNNAVDDKYAKESPLDFSEFKDRNRRASEKKKIYGEEITTDNIDNETGRVLSDEELEVLWNLDELKMNDRLYLFLQACYYTGARPAGVIDIKVKDINFSMKKIKIKPMKKAKSYEAKVSDVLLDLLRDWIVKYGLIRNNHIFFPIQTYQRAKNDVEKKDAKNKHANYSGYRRYLQKVFDPVFNVGIDSYDRMSRVNVYSMRRTAATKVYRKFGIVHAKEFLNHTDIKTTMHYLNIDNDMADIDYGL